MFKFFTPDKLYDNVYQIDFDELAAKGIKGLIFDIDNTLVSYKQPTPTDEVVALLQALQEKGFKVCFVSNNTQARVELFNQELNLPAFANAKKPLKKYMNLALEALKVTPSQTAIIGDQLFTDVCAGKRIKILTLVVAPIEPVETLFFKVKRALEKPIIKKYRKLNQSTNDKN